MLLSLEIQHFTLINQLSLEFNHGMTVLTGETGAGKSIIIDALSLCLGARADSKTVREGAKQAQISAAFGIAKLPLVQQWLEGNELSSDDECIIRRTISQDGRSKCYINGQMVPLAHLKTLGAMLVDVHSQHANHSLLQVATQRVRLDHYGKHEKTLAAVHDAYQSWAALEKKRVALLQAGDQSAEKALLEYQVAELEEMGLEAGEWKTLSDQQQTLQLAQGLKQDYQTAYDLTGSTDNPSALSLVAQAKGQLTPYQGKINNIDKLIAQLNNIEIELNETTRDLEHLIADTEEDPDTLMQVEARMEKLHQLARKHQVAPEALPEKYTTLTDALATLSEKAEDLAGIDEEISIAAEHYQQAAKALSQARKTTADKLAKAITKQLPKLGLPHGKLSIALKPLETFSAHGNEQIEFLVTTNPGVAPQGLSKVASGGELSRISLAIQVLTAKAQGTPCLIFDEVDVGIGGGTAEVVGQMLNQLGKQAQVLCITHQPQVAAQGHTHLQVCKQASKTKTESKIQLLSEAERIQEIARMLGGIKLTKKTLAHAAEMLN